MHQPLGFRDNNHPDHVCLLKKSLYGLKQSPRAWYQQFADFVRTISFKHSMSDHSLFIYRKGNDVAYLLLYVDGIILTSYSHNLQHTLTELLAREFAMKDLVPLSYFLGITVQRHSQGLFLSQTKYAKEIIEHVGMSSCKLATTPVDTNSKLDVKTDDPFPDPTYYRSLVGALKYLLLRGQIFHTLYNKYVFICTPHIPLICML